MYIFEFTSEYIKKPVRNSDEDRQVINQQKAAEIEVCPAIEELYNLLSEYAEKHVRCIVENTYI